MADDKASLSSARCEADALRDASYFKRVIKEGYERCADQYLAEHAQYDPGDMRLPTLRTVLASLPHGAHVLDIGCGAGVPVAKAVVEDLNELRVTGVDLSERMVALAREQVPSERARFLCCDMSEVELPEDTYDAVTAFFSIFHLPRAEHGGMFRKVAGWLRAGGVFVFNIGEDTGEVSCEDDFVGVPMVWSCFGQEGTAALLREVGLIVESIERRSATATDAVDKEGVVFVFFTARKPEQKTQD
eukprot:TRINITY_DN76413_c0_g1_i1.p1 TRINITY_DN76413_c0_g1~~TRINITY_DN76413_c0_g1_i1.p1  ORF type:complete len:245 (-),score=53.31 TRINITY_DN76413_c0_g1_i1:9-743(-)